MIRRKGAIAKSSPDYGAHQRLDDIAVDDYSPATQQQCEEVIRRN